MKNLGILLSGRGSNFEAIANNVSAGRIPDAQIAVVISNKPDAAGIETARRLGLTRCLTAAFLSARWTSLRAPLRPWAGSCSSGGSH